MLTSDLRGTKQFRNFVETYQNNVIERLVVCRKPIYPIIEKVANIISLGKFNQIKGKLGYDNFFHLYIFMVFDNGEGWIMQKNEVLNAKRTDTPESGSNCMSVNIPDDLTLSKLIHPAIQIMRHDFATYDYINNNCQIWVKNILDGADLLTPNLYNFIVQDVETVAKSIPEVGNILANYAVDTARKIDTLLHGKGNMQKKFNSSTPHFLYDVA